jgi:hypothetical protein
LKTLADAGPVARAELGGRGRAYAEEHLCMSALGTRLEAVLAETILRFQPRHGRISRFREVAHGR